MKKTILLLNAAVLLMTSCADQPHSTNTDPDTAHSADTVMQTLDSSMMVLDRYFTWEKISKTEYDKVSDPYEMPPRDVENIEDFYFKQFYSAIRRRDSTTLEIECAGKVFELKDVPFEDSEVDMVHHRFHGKAGELAIVMEYYYESFAFHFYDLNSCDHHLCIGYPVLSPDAGHILAYNADLIAQFTPNGMQYFSRKGEKWVLQWELEISDWEPHGLKWENTNTLVLIARKPDFGSDTPPEDQYYRLRLK